RQNPQIVDILSHLFQVRLGRCTEVKAEIDERAFSGQGKFAVKDFAIGSASEEVPEHRRDPPLRRIYCRRRVFGYGLGESKMNVRVDQTWEDVQARRIDYLDRVCARSSAKYCRDTSVFDSDIGICKSALGANYSAVPN